ncbi:succinylglutamate desuccinylase/aspartoacylase family protein [Photobacterium ganghwense]|uniref:Succinylglutamate desuccinylase n=1 Tax=Photobacterium ganghwense TaxID=320778 RepID=A0A0J1HH00_9GAMM|nr:succinylglutamate desuccinylase/aspartoacylase family protein [Photobacterium ganghwense]KLV10901.1 succinylglutamate desuccinylase [Photobacterium ganghwense]PSU10912.1 succinylglutamate desuccinylase [Photobacterium ganghwense]
MIATEKMKVGEQPTGNPMEISVIRIQGSGNGPRVYIQANVHGAEVQGNAVIYQLLEFFRQHPPEGDVVLVPLANPMGINQKSGEFTLGRFDPVTGVNWNRQYHFDASLIAPFCEEYRHAEETVIREAFRGQLRQHLHERLNSPWGLTCGQHLAINLQLMAVEADIVLDLHTGPISARHLYVPEYARERARYFNIPLNILIPSDFSGAMDEASFSPWWQLSEAFAKFGRPLPVMVDAFTIELGSQEKLNVQAAREDALGICQYLQHQGLWSATQVVECEPVTQHACYLKDYKAFFSPAGGQVEYHAAVNQPLAAGEPLVTLWHFNALASEACERRDLALHCDAIPVLHFASASVNQGTELYKVMTNTFPL